MKSAATPPAFKMFLFSILGAWAVCLHTHLYITGVTGADGSQKRALDPLKRELWRVVS